MNVHVVQYCSRSERIPMAFQTCYERVPECIPNVVTMCVPILDRKGHRILWFTDLRWLDTVFNNLGVRQFDTQILRV